MYKEPGSAIKEPLKKKLMHGASKRRLKFLTRNKDIKNYWNLQFLHKFSLQETLNLYEQSLFPGKKSINKN